MNRMIEMNRERSDEKIAAAKLAIRKLLDQGERVSVPQLVKMTGASRGFFYKNPIVRAEIDRAMEQQAGTINPRRGILDKAWKDGSISFRKKFSGSGRKIRRSVMKTKDFRKSLARKAGVNSEACK